MEHEVTGSDIIGIADEQIPLGATVAIDIDTHRARVIRPPCTNSDCEFCFHHGVPVIGVQSAAPSSGNGQAANVDERMGNEAVSP